MDKLPSCTRRVALLLSGFLLCNPAGAGEIDPAAASKPQVVTVTGHFYSDLRPYSWYLPGIREFNKYHHLAPDGELRFGLVSASSKKPLPLAQARLESTSWLGEDWTLDLPVNEDGWFTIPDSEEAERRRADVVISRRSMASVTWAIEVHTPSLPPQAYRLGDLRLECRVYLAIEWAKWHGRKVMGQDARGVTKPPMDAACGRRWVFFNTRPWPRLQAYVLSEGERKVRHELNGWFINSRSFSLDLSQDEGSSPWSDDARIEFVFYDNSHWQPLKPPEPAPEPVPAP
jgi:hypothetical protein